MAELAVGPVHHIRLSVNDLDKSRAFYTEVMGLEVAMDTLPPADDPNYELLAETLQGGIVLVNSNTGMLLGLRPTDAERQAGRDRFDPFRCGLDHLSFGLATRDELTAAMARLDDLGIPHGGITELTPFALAVLPFCDPDGIQLELASPM